MLVVKYGPMKNSPIKKAATGPRSSAEVAAEMSTLGAMLPGSIRKTFRTYSTKKRGEVRVEAQPIYTTWDPVKKRQVSRHVPKERFEEIRAMTLNYARYRELQREFDAALGCSDDDDFAVGADGACLDRHTLQGAVCLESS